MEKLCKGCGKAFEVKQSQFERRQYCSQQCKQQAKRVTLVCGQCGKNWWSWKSQTIIHGRPGAGQFCSRVCAGLAKRKPKPERPPKVVTDPIFKSCEVCDTTFRVYPSRKDTARFCSLVCKVQSESYRALCSEQQQGEKSWRWGGGKYKRGTGYIRQKRNKNCIEIYTFEHQEVMVAWLLEEEPSHPFLVEVDGRKRLHPDVEVHHIDRIRSNNVRNNLLAVIKPAHAQIHHRGKKPEPWECWPINPPKW